MMHHPRRAGGGRRERQPVWSNYALCRLGTRTACGDAQGAGGDSPARLCKAPRFRAAPALLAFAAAAGAFAALGGRRAGVAGVGITPAQAGLQLAGQRGVIPVVRAAHDKGAYRTGHRRAQRPAGPAAPATPARCRVCRCWTPGPVSLSGLIAVAVIRWRIGEDHQLARQSTGPDAGQVIRWKSWHRWTAVCLLACICLAVAVAVQRQARRRFCPGRRADPGHRCGTAAAPARHCHSAAPARPGPLVALGGLATPPPAPSPASLPALERLRRGDTVITTNCSCRI